MKTVVVTKILHEARSCSETPKTGFLATRLIFTFVMIFCFKISISTKSIAVNKLDVQDICFGKDRSRVFEET